MEGFTYTGNEQQCLLTYLVRKVTIIDDQNILFEATGPDYYLNHLPRACARLSSEKSFLYELHGINELCDSDSITVLIHHGTSRPLLRGSTCGLGTFERLESKGQER